MNPRELLVGTFTVALTLSITFGIVELAMRVKHQKYDVKNFVEQNWNLASLEFPIQYDPVLGWIPKENFSSQSKDSKEKITLLKMGIRSNGLETSSTGADKPILVVGASTVYGSQVSDDQTWPAFLEKETQQKVINAGVFAYGFDQIVLRLEKLIPLIHPRWVILGFHPDNLTQVTMSQKYGKKPYYELVNDRLVLKNTPVPVTKKELKPFQAILGFSYLAHYLLSRLAPQVWLEGHGEIRVNNQENEISCLLLKKYDELCKANRLKCSVLVQYFHTTVVDARQKIIQLENCAQTTSLAFWDTFEPLEKIKRVTPKLYDSFFDFHMTPKGNAWTAHYIKQKMTETN